MKKKALSLLMAAVLLATAPASVSLASETAPSDALVVSEMESETSAEDFAEENTAAEPEATDIIPDIQMADAAEIAVDENEENTASESVGTDEETGVSVEEMTADEAATEEATAEEAAVVSAAAPEAAISVETESEETAEDETVAAEIAAEDGVAAASVEAAAVSEDSDLTVDYNSSSSFTIELGSTATMSVTASSSYGPITYKWWKEDTVISGATSDSLTVSEPGEYFCQVSDGYSTTTKNFLCV
ncbi:MAG: hypothetical protein LUI39_04520 [Lachnospiraceae bacterium]|nr:hypothetical protein [Lachnospiraceae bacterium]